MRIANAVGEVGFVSSVAVLTDLTLLYFLGLISVPAVREFCTFAAIALVVDFFLHLTYFLAVLSIDVRRLELQELRFLFRRSPRRYGPWHLGKVVTASFLYSNHNFLILIS